MNGALRPTLSAALFLVLAFAGKQMVAYTLATIVPGR